MSPTQERMYSRLLVCGTLHAEGLGIEINHQATSHVQLQTGSQHIAEGKSPKLSTGDFCFVALQEGVLLDTFQTRRTSLSIALRSSKVALTLDFISTSHTKRNLKLN